MMIKKLARIAVVLVLAGALVPAVSASGPLPLAGHTIAVDPGHGGPGDVGSTVCAELSGSDAYLEKNVNLDIALRLEALLRAQGAEVYLTRTTDVGPSNHERADGINGSNAEVLVVLHLNGWDDPTLDGLYVLFGKARKDKAFAQAMHDAMWANPALVATQDEFVDFDVWQLAAGVMIWVDIPSALTESVFISNTWECTQLQAGTRQDEIAQAIYEGLEAWFSEPQPPGPGKGR
jgi:N-acetylmuramoyl-L-alanine amidase